MRYIVLLLLLGALAQTCLAAGGTSYKRTTGYQFVTPKTRHFYTPPKPQPKLFTIGRGLPNGK